MKQPVNIFWFRRDLRLNDNAGLYHALKANFPVLALFIFDTNILDKLTDKDDARVTFIHNSLHELNNELQAIGSSLLVKHGNPEDRWLEIINEFDLKNVYANADYEPYASTRDKKMEAIFKANGIAFHTYKDHILFDYNEVLKDDGKPYTVFTPYKSKWLTKLTDFYVKAYPSQKYQDNFLKVTSYKIPALANLGFEKSGQCFPDKEYKDIIEEYSKTRDYPAINGTSRISMHLRFGTLSIRDLVKNALKSSEKTWLSELIWRDFYSMILGHFPRVVNQAFKPDYDHIQWRNNEAEFKGWCDGKTGYPIVDAGMRELNETGFMHNRVRMITASFLCKHLLIDWRWGEAYFARKLLDYDQASNVGGWQWAAGSGNDAVPYFRIFNPELQTKKFDPDLLYIRKWIPEFDEPFKYPQPIVDHKFARERVLVV